MVRGETRPLWMREEPYLSDNTVSSGRCSVFDDFVEDVIINKAVELAMVGYKEHSLQTQIYANERKE